MNYALELDFHPSVDVPPPSIAVWRLYRLSTPLDECEHVVVSSIHSSKGPEVSIFAATPKGDVLTWSPLRTLLGTRDHAAAFADAGYSVVEKS